MLSVVYIEKICRVECRLPLNQIFVQGKVIKCPSKIAPGAFAFCQYENETNKIMFVDGLWSACRPDWQHTSACKGKGILQWKFFSVKQDQIFKIVPVIPFLFLLLMYQYLRDCITRTDSCEIAAINRRMQAFYSPKYNSHIPKKKLTNLTLQLR